MARRSGSNGAKTARELKAAALRLFAEHGYAAVSMRQIARAVGVQAGALYLYTPDKQTLLADLMVEHLTRLQRAWEEARTADDAPPRTRLERFVRFHIHYHLNCVDEVFIAYMELRNLVPENFARVELERRAYEAELELILKDGQASEQFGVRDTRLATLAIIAMLTGVTTWYRDGGRLSVEQIEERYVEMVMGTVGA